LESINQLLQYNILHYLKSDRVLGHYHILLQYIFFKKLFVPPCILVHTTKVSANDIPKYVTVLHLKNIS
jgi:hypothetical protein